MAEFEQTYPGIWIWGGNPTGYTFFVGSGVGVGAALRAAIGPEDPLRVPHELSRLTADTRVWGVAIDVIPPNGCGRVQISGVCPARISGEETDFVRPDSGMLRYCGDGYPVLRKSSGDSDSLPLIRLGGEPITQFSGQFKVVRGAAPGTFRCIDGTAPDSETAGQTDLGAVAAGEIAPTSRTFYLYARWTGGSYALSFTRPSSGSFGQLQLAHLSPDGEIVQDHTIGYIHWSEYYTV